jgi:hypothetical protein
MKDGKKKVLGNSSLWHQYDLEFETINTVDEWWLMNG